MFKEMPYSAELINLNDGKTSTVVLESTVTFMEIPDGDEKTYTIVGTVDANPIEHKISMDSSIGKTLLVSKTNDKLFIDIPSGKIEVKVIDVH